MEPQAYRAMSGLDLLKLVLWREARSESYDGKRAVAWSIKNRADHPAWWGDGYQNVILKPWQYSSFNLADPNNTKWPEDTDPSFVECAAVATNLLNGADTQDLTDGATNYYDTSIAFPKAWGSEDTWTNTLNIGRLRFWKLNG